MRYNRRARIGTSSGCLSVYFGARCFFITPDTHSFSMVRDGLIADFKSWC